MIKEIEEILEKDASESGCGCTMTVQNAGPILNDVKLGDSISVNGIIDLVHY